ncbi:MAG TPA: alpha/beta fold hydrolase [Vicinamibacterales bacterium]|jgi:3-oxoadipate enol-lactonase/4-carboxymuconolactone decarboxylase
MPLIDINGHRCFYRLDGRDADPAVVLSHSLGLDHALWDTLTAALLPHARVLRYDTRGHGASEATAGDYRIETLARDALALADALGIRTFAWCGLSLGGMIGQWLGANAPERLTRLVLANTSAHVDAQVFEQRRVHMLDRGLDDIIDTVMSRNFSPRGLASGDPAVDWVRRTVLGSNRTGYAGCCAAIRDHDGRPLLARIGVPTLVISGDADASMPPPQHGQLLAAGIPGARAISLDAGHLSNLERPRAFNAAVLDCVVPAAADIGAAGMAMRRAVLGDAHVDRAVAAQTDFTREFQALITTFAWGTIWTRPALDRPTRRLLVLAMTASMGRWEEFRLHVRTGLAAELDESDLKEVLLQVAVYAGVPAANTAFQIAAEELSRERREPPGPGGSRV